MDNAYKRYITCFLYVLCTYLHDTGFDNVCSCDAK